MDNKEIALQLTLKALECDKIHFHKGLDGTAEEASETNIAAAKLIAEFYNTMLESLPSKAIPALPKVN